MATEAQLVNDLYWPVASGTRTRVGWLVNISSRYISSLSFLLYRTGATTGNVTFTIRKSSDDSLLGSAVWGDASTLPVSIANRAWKQVTFSSPVFVNEEVRLLCEYSGGDYGPGIYIGVSSKNTDIKANEYLIHYTSPSYTAATTNDCAYSYEYSGGSSSSPVATCQAMTDVASTTATGNGNVTDLGAPLATQHGHVWATHPNPTTSDSKTENGVPSATGAYTSSLTSLSPNTLYYCRAYVINELGTFYSNTMVTFTTTASTAVVTTRAVSAIAALSASGNGTITSDGGSAITAHGVCWSTSANPTTGDDLTDHGVPVSLGDFSSLMTGLTANTAYHVRAYVTNGSGTSYGADVTFTTLAAGAPIVTIQPCTDVQPTTATGNGTIVNIGGSAVTQHGHCWSTSINPTTTNSKTTNGAGSAGVFTSLITGLTAGTPYYVRAYATNTQGTAYSDNELLNYDNPEVPPGTEPSSTPCRIAVLNEYLVYNDMIDGTQRALLGRPF